MAWTLPKPRFVHVPSRGQRLLLGRRVHMRAALAVAETFAASRGWMLRRGALAGLVVALAIASSGIVFSEPAPTDALMIAVMVAVPVLGVGRLGGTSLVNFGLWLAIVALGLAAVSFSPTFDTALKHQLVTLFLAGGAFALAGYIAADPAPRMRLVLACYVAAALIATIAALLGYFRLLPGAFELFTNYGRGRGTFKDPNVYGAAIAPAIVTCVWYMLRETPRRAAIAAAVALPLVIGLLVSFSRGAWISVAISVAILVGVALLTSRRKTDFRRFGSFAAVGVGAVVAALLAVMQIEQVGSLLRERASFDQSYDSGPEGRFGGQAKARQLILDNPLGIGTHTFREVHHREEPHNVYLSMFLNAGWLGGLFYLVTVAATLFAGLSRALERGVLQGPMLIVAASFAGLAFEGYVIDSDHWRTFFILIGCIWGLADAAPVLTNPARRSGD